MVCRRFPQTWAFQMQMGSKIITGKRWASLAIAVAVLLEPGCSRKFYRQKADQEVDGLLASKDHYKGWQIEGMNYYPDPRSRFASPGVQDKPAMPPDDPASMVEAPQPQKPGKAGVNYLEGAGYLELLSLWDNENRAELVKARQPDQSLASEDESGTSRRGAGYGSNSWQQDKLLSQSLGQMEGAIDVRGESESPEAPKSFRVKLEQCSELGLINSREFQTQREEVYLAALPVTAERFAFAPQFFANEQAVREWSGSDVPEGLRNRWRIDSELGVTKRFATGALLLAKFANQTVLEMGNGSPRLLSPSLVSWDFFQPLFLGGGKAVTLEALTLAERQLLYEIRTYARFRKQFYANIAAGGSIQNLGLTNIPAARPFLGSLPGSGVAGAGFVQVSPGEGNFSRVGPQVFDAPNEGFLANLLRAGLLANERENVESLAGYYDQYREFQAVGDISELQVSLVRQQLISSQNRVIQAELLLRDGLDAYKLQLGLPTNIPLELDDAILAEQRNHLEKYQELTSQAADARRKVRKLMDADAGVDVRKEFEKVFESSPIIRKTVVGKRSLAMVQEYGKLDAMGLATAIKQVSEKRRSLEERKDLLGKQGSKIPQEVTDGIRDAEIALYALRFERSLRNYADKRKAMQGQAGMEREKAATLAAFEGVLEDFVLLFVQPRNELLGNLKRSWPAMPVICVEGTDLQRDPLDKALDAGARYALLNRLDLMNARGELVDSWRQIAVAANSLMGAVDVRYHGESLSPVDVARPLAFSGSRARHSLAINAEAPLVRILERNAYRTTLFNWQRQRRNLMAFEDTIVLAVRRQIRGLRALARNYELQKQVIELAYLNIDNALETLYAPVPGVQGAGSDGNQAALTTQLLNTQSSKIVAQNSLFTFWINYQQTRIQLYRDLELMPLDGRGVWIDDIATCQCNTNSATGRGSERENERLPGPKPEGNGTSNPPSPE